MAHINWSKDLIEAGLQLPSDTTIRALRDLNRRLEILEGPADEMEEETLDELAEYEPSHLALRIRALDASHRIMKKMWLKERRRARVVVEAAREVDRVAGLEPPPGAGKDYEEFGKMTEDTFELLTIALRLYDEK